MARIGFDIDGVAYNFVYALRDEICRETGVPKEELPDAETWNFFKDQWKFTTKQYHEFVINGVKNNKIFWRGDTYEKCKEVVDYMYHVRGDEITFITARTYPGIENLCRYATEYWLNEVANLPYHHLEVIGHDGTKEGRQFDVLFDDAPHHIENAIIAGENAILFDQPWNRHMTYAERVHGWAGILNYVEEKFPVGKVATISS